MQESLVVRPQLSGNHCGVVNTISAGDAGWKNLNMNLRRMKQGDTWDTFTSGFEMAIVLLGGRCHVKAGGKQFENIGGRRDVFDGMPYAVYIPRETECEVEALSELLEIAVCWVPSDHDLEPRLISPADSKIEIRGGGNATRQINSIMPPGFSSQRIVCVEVYTPGGNWSSYPPHKHDVHYEENGELKEAALEEIYFYKFRRPEGFAVQRIYTDDRDLDQTVTAQHNDIVLVPRGYHPVSAAYGYDCYYLNFLAGTAQSLANSDDPAYAWVKGTWADKDPRVPVVTHAMEERRKSELVST